jgi:hypothetical protein
MMVEDEFGGRRMNDLRTVVWLNMIDSVGAPLWLGVHLLALVGSLAGFVDLKSDVARCPKHVLSDLGPETLLASPCARLFVREVDIIDINV